MKKIIFSLTKFSRNNGNTKTKGIGYIDGNNFILALHANNGMPYVKIFEDAVKLIHLVPARTNEYAGYLSELVTIQSEVKENSFEEKQITIDYHLWYSVLDKQ